MPLNTKNAVKDEPTTHKKLQSLVTQTEVSNIGYFHNNIPCRRCQSAEQVTGHHFRHSYQFIVASSRVEPLKKRFVAHTQRKRLARIAQKDQ